MTHDKLETSHPLQPNQVTSVARMSTTGSKRRPTPRRTAFPHPRRAGSR